MRYLRKEFSNTVLKWEPLFEADVSALSLLGDAVSKFNQAMPNFLTPDIIYDLSGIKGNMDVKPAQEVIEQKTVANENGADKQKNRIISTYEITSLLSNYQKGVLSKENGITLLMSTGMSEAEATEMLNKTKIEDKTAE